MVKNKTECPSNYGNGKFCFFELSVVNIDIFLAEVHNLWTDIKRSKQSLSGFIGIEALYQIHFSSMKISLKIFRVFLFGCTTAMYLFITALLSGSFFPMAKLISLPCPRRLSLFLFLVLVAIFTKLSYL